MGIIWTADDGDISQYPFDSRVPRKLVIAGKYKRKLTQLKEQADRKRGGTMRELTPPLQSDEERGQGDSTNARLHRIIRGTR